MYTPYSTNEGEEVDPTANIPEYPPTSGSDKVNELPYSGYKLFRGYKLSRCSLISMYRGRL